MPHKILGEIAVTDGVTTQVTNASAGTYNLITGFNTAQGADRIFINCTLAKASNKITTIFAGLYKVHFGCSFEGENSQTTTFQLFTAGNASGIFTARSIGTGGTDRGYCGFSDRPIDIADGVDVDMRVTSSGNSKNFLPRHMWLVIEKA